MINTVFLVILLATSSLAVDVVFNSFDSNDLIFTGDARVDSSIIRLTNNSNEFSIGRAFYPYPFSYKTNDFASTSFVFSILPQADSTAGFGFAYVYSNSTVPSGNLSGQYFGLFSNTTVPTTAHALPAPLLLIEFDTGQNPELNDSSNNHIGINLNSAKSLLSHEAGYYNSTTGEFVPIDMRSGKNIQAWIEFDGRNIGVNVTIAPAGVHKPFKPLISFSDPSKANFLSTTMFVGFSASRTTWKEEQRILAWSLSDEGFARDIDTSNLPVFSHSSLLQNSSSSSLPAGIRATIIIVSAVALALFLSLICWCWIKKKIDDQNEQEKIQEWELEYWPHRFSYEDLSEATNGFSKNLLLGSGGFGKVYKGILPNNIEIAVKCVNHDSNQGLREFMAEISSIGRLQHKNLVHMRGWCKKGRELMLVYDFVPNGSLSRWVFGKSLNHLGWEIRHRVLTDVAEAINYLHHGWHQLVLHRDIKSSNILLDSCMRGMLGDFGLAKLYGHGHGQSATTTRLVGTIGYMAPELVRSGASTASDVYSFGVLVLEVVCGRRPLKEGEPMIIEWVQELHTQGRLLEAADKRIAGEYNVDELVMVLNLGLKCCDANPQPRPTMKDIVAMLTDVNKPPSTDYVINNQLELSGASESITSKISCISDLSART